MEDKRMTYIIMNARNMGKERRFNQIKELISKGKIKVKEHKELTKFTMGIDLANGNDNVSYCNTYLITK